MLTHVHKVVNTCWCWHICKGGGVWAVERGLRSSRGNETLIFLYAKVENWRRSRGRVPRCFPSIRRWLRRRRTLALGASDAGVSVRWLTLGGALLVSLHQTRWWSGNGRWTSASALCDVSCSRGDVALSTRQTLMSAFGDGVSDASDDHVRKRAL
jgi:hypothetical protein